MKQRIFFDMDGTLAQWRAASQEESYEKGFFKNLIPHYEALDLAKHFLENESDWDVYILSAVLPNSTYSVSGKNSWLDEHLPEISYSNRIFVSASLPKHEAVPGGIRPTDVLIDDYTKNLKEWDEHAVAIKYLNGINGTQKTWTGECVRIHDERDKSIATIKLAAADACLAYQPQHHCARFLAFIDALYVRDAQAYLSDCLSDDIDIHDEEHETGWQDISGPVLVYDGIAINEAAVLEQLYPIYPYTSSNVFTVMQIDNCIQSDNKSTTKPGVKPPTRLTDEWDRYYDNPECQEILRIYYNPQAVCGGQFVLDYIPYSLIAEAKAEYDVSGEVEDFYCVIAEKCRQELVDITDADFNKYAAILKNEPATLGNDKDMSAENLPYHAALIEKLCYLGVDPVR